MIALAPAHTAQLCNYTSWLEKNKFPYKILRPGDSLKGFSMLILCGGPDVGKPNVEIRDMAEKAWFKEAYGTIPVLGICRGLQLANIEAGGTLHEDLSEVPIKHSSNKTIAGEPSSLLESSWHDVVFEDGKKIRVNSRHHQAIKDLAPTFKPLAKADGDDIYEMVEGINSMFVQWHPEREDVWGTEAEKIVSSWVKSKIDISESEDIDVLGNLFEKIVNYLYSKGFNIISRERIMKSIDTTCNNVILDQLVENYPVKNVTDKNGKPAIKLLSNWRIKL